MLDLTDVLGLFAKTIEEAMVGVVILVYDTRVWWKWVIGFFQSSHV